MDNFTPLKINNKPKINRLLVFANLFLVILSIGLPVFFLSDQNRKIVTDEKAAVMPPTIIPTSTTTPTNIPTITPIITPIEASTPATLLTPNLTVTP